MTSGSVTPTGAPMWRSWLYVPGDRPEVVDKAIASNADCVVIDLEDAVTADRKGIARANACATLAGHQTESIVVRINAPDTPWHAEDLAALAQVGARNIRIPKCESPDVLVDIAEHMGKGCSLHVLIESARGLQASDHLASAAPTVQTISLGETDLKADLGITHDKYLAYARGRVVASARAAGLGRPPASVFTNLQDTDGLRHSTVEARSAGFFGRGVIHPRQVDTVNAIFTPTQGEVDRAHEIVAALSVNSGGQSSSSAVAVLPNGQFVDPAVLAGAHNILTLADRYGINQEELND